MAKIQMILETKGWAVQFKNGSFYNGLDSAVVFHKRSPFCENIMTTVPYADRVRFSSETLRTFKTDHGARRQALHLVLAGYDCEVIPVRTTIYPG